MATLNTLVNFNGTNGSDPEAGLISDTAGDLFGTTEGGNGTVFEIPFAAGSYASTPTTLISFDTTDGNAPSAGLIADTAGDLFGTTFSGGATDQGTVFEIVKSGGSFASTPTVLVSFNATDGESPSAGLMSDSAGDLFGTTSAGATDNAGTVFEIVKTGSSYASTPTTLINFNNINGGGPQAGLVADSAGDLFGTTNSGGTDGAGEVFEVVKTGSSFASTPTVLINFTGAANGQNPLAGLIIDSAGDLFGTTAFGGANPLDGAVYEIVKTGGSYASTATLLASFNGNDGSSPEGDLLEDASGDLFGTTSGGGADSDGTVFEIVKTGGSYSSTPTTVFTFNGSDGQQPVADLIANASGDLFGTTQLGGASSDGTAFELTGTGFQPPTPVILPNYAFYGNGMSDILFDNDSTGQVAIWEMDGAAITSSPIIATIGNPAWQPQASADFNGDTFDDILFHNSTTGQIAVWEMNGGNILNTAIIGALADPAWQVAGAGDFDVSGDAGILFENSATGQIAIWETNGLSLTASAIIGDIANLAWKIAGVGDFTGNGTDDMLFMNSATGQVAIWEMNNDTVATSAIIGTLSNTAWQAIGVGDFDGTGSDDILFVNNQTGQVATWNTNGTGITSSAIIGTISNSAVQIFGTGAYFGGSTDDILWQNTATGQISIWQMSGGTVAATANVAAIGSSWIIEHNPDLAG